MKILVTGCCGFIGYHTCRRLTKEGHEVYGIDSLNDYYDVTLKQNNLIDLEVLPNFYFHRGDIGKTKLIKEVQPDVIIHLAAYAGVRKSLESPQLYIQNNLTATCHLLQEAVEYKVKLFLFASSSSVYGLNDTPFRETDTLERVNSVYAWTKHSMEELCALYHRLYGLNAIGMRFFTVYGPRGRPDMAPLKFLKAIDQEETILQFGDGKSLRDYTYIDDIVNGIIALQERYLNETKFELFNLGNNKTTTLTEFIHLCEIVVGKPAKIKVIENQKGDVPKTFANIDKARRIIGYQPEVDVFSGLRQTYTWMQLNQENKDIDIL